MVTASPPVSPSVVARILMIQKRNVTCGTFATRSDFLSSICYSPLKIIVATDNRGRRWEVGSVGDRCSQINSKSRLNCRPHLDSRRGLNPGCSVKLRTRYAQQSGIRNRDQPSSRSVQRDRHRQEQPDLYLFD